MKKGQRHVLVLRQDVVHEQRNVVDTLCFDGATGIVDQRHMPDAKVLPIRLQPGEKALITNVELLYCTNDTDRAWHFQLHGELWDGQQGGPPLSFVVPAGAKGPVPKLDRLLYRNQAVAKWPTFVQYLGQEHAILGAHSTCVSPDGLVNLGFQLFRESDPFLQFLRQNWSLFKGISEFDLVLLKNEEKKEEDPIYQVSQAAIDRATHCFKTVFAEIHYKSRDTPLRLTTDQAKFDLPSETKTSGASFSGVVILLSLDYITVAPAAPKCRIMDYPLNLTMII